MPHHQIFLLKHLDVGLLFVSSVVQPETDLDVLVPIVQAYVLKHPKALQIGFVSKTQGHHKYKLTTPP